MRHDAAPVGGLAGIGGSVRRPVIERLESGVHLRLLRGRKPRDAAEQGLEKVGWTRRRIPAFSVVAGDEIAGAAAGAGLLLSIWPQRPADLGATVPHIAAGSAFLYEVVLTGALMFVITAVATDTRAQGSAAAIAIGGTVALDALFGGPITGASMNPARSFGPALASGQWHDFWIYVIAPVAGASLGALAYQLIRGAPPMVAPTGQPTA